MPTKTICYFLFILCSVLIIQVKSQICNGMAQYDRCSANAGCACLHIAGAINVGICSYLSLARCAELVNCDHNNVCYEPEHTCVHHPQCQSAPVCFPVPIFNRQLCPLLTMTNATTTTTTRPTTTTARGPQLVIPNIPANAKWAQYGMTVAGGEGNGNATNQLSYPAGLFVDDDQTVLIADSWNNRIMQWKPGDKNGQVVAGGNGPGERLDQLKNPTDVLIDKETDSLIICDSSNLRVVRWSRRSGTIQGEILIDNILCANLAMDDQRYLYVTAYFIPEVKQYRLGDKNGTVVAGGNGNGAGLNQLYYPTYVFVDRQQNVYVSDSNNSRVMQWNKGAKEGIIVAECHDWMNNATTQLCGSTGLFVDTLGTLYAADSVHVRIMSWTQGAQQGTVIVGGNGEGSGANQFIYPTGLSFDRHGNLYVVDQSNHRVQRFSIE
ncbi:unnamed protein product [Rotaria socialis]